LKKIIRPREEKTAFLVKTATPFSAIFALRRAIFNLTVERYCAFRRSDIFCFRKMLMKLFAEQKAFVLKTE
jgi:hypothetical protein